MAVATVDDVVSMIGVGTALPFQKTLTAPKAAGAFQSAWMAAGNPGAGVASPAFNAGSGYTADKSTAGAVPYVNGSVQNWIARLSMMGTNVAGTLILFDRLWSCSGMGFAAATYTVTTPGNLPARITDNGVGCELWVEQFVAAGAASGTLTANYLNANTGAAKAGVIAAVVSAPVAGQMQPVPLAAGDTGIRQLTSVVTSATWTSGSFGMSIVKRIAEIPCGAVGVMTMLDWAGVLRRFPADACIFGVWAATSTTAPVVQGTILQGDK